MDAEKLHEEGVAELNRLSVKHNREWEEIIREMETALGSANTTNKTVREIKKISKDYEKRFDDLREKQKREMIQLQRNYSDRLLSL